MNHYFATVARGLETLAAAELAELGAVELEPGFCGVRFSGDQALMYRVNLWARLPFRILWQLGTFSCPDRERFMAGLDRLAWERVLTPEMSFAVTVTGKSSELNHSRITAIQSQHQIQAAQTRQFRDYSPVNLQAPDVLINLHLEAEVCTVSLDSSGSSLHRRGYRPAVGSAPLKESLAAALIRLSQWQPEQMFYDPLCGSGTLPLEAGLIGLNIAPGLYRSKFGFETWRNQDLGLFAQLKQEAQAAQHQTLAAPIWGSDADATVIKQALDNATEAGLGQHLYFCQLELEEIAPPTDSGLVFCNPPYGERLGAAQELGEFYRRLGQILKQRFRGWTAFILSGNKLLSQEIGLKSAQRFPVYNGSLPCQLLKYELY